jgi:hypothetical protein
MRMGSDCLAAMGFLWGDENVLQLDKADDYMTL